MENQNTNFLNSVQNATPEQLDVQTTKNGGTQMNVVNAVNANGIVSGRKVVDFIWQRIGVCAMIIAAGCMIAVIVMVIIANSINVEGVKAGLERDALKEKVEGMYKLLKVDDQADAIAALSKEDAFDGEDFGQLMVLITSKYGADVEFDYSDNNKIFLRKNGMYKVISLVVKTKSGSERVFAFSPVSKTSWKIAAYNAALDDPCEKSSADEKSALKNIVTCPEDE
ncbi:hypothetical protein IKH79_02990 [Candidatus Saccharibacteria bacterium]|nr:hypothetical protein [Candidatus Saccharibacteria bacterium]